MNVIKNTDIFIAHLGHGGFGYVDLVDTFIGEQKYRCARKTLSIDPKNSQNDILNIRKRFIQEVTLQRSLKHRNIVSILKDDLNIENPRYYMPQAINGFNIDIDKNISAKTNTPFLSDTFLNALNDIASGLEYIHNNNIHHRDLKPQNVLKFSDKQNYFYAISDFGLASIDDTNITQLTTTFMQKGQDYYTAPEIMESLKNHSIQSDIFSFGCILHDIIGQKKRYPGREINEWNNPYFFILKKCTEEHPQNRFPTIKDVFTAILNVSLLSNNYNHQQDYNDITKDLNNNLTNLITNQDIILFCKQLFSYLQKCDNQEKLQILLFLNEKNLSKIYMSSKDIYNNIAELLAKWIGSTDFTFAYCDTITDKLILFFPLVPNPIKSYILIGLLKLGTRHNRWYVERTFWNYLLEMDNSLIDVFNNNLHIEGSSILNNFDHLSSSISVDLNNINPRIRNTLNQLKR